MKFTTPFNTELHIGGFILLPPKLSSRPDHVSILVTVPQPNAVQFIIKSFCGKSEMDILIYCCDDCTVNTGLL